MTTEQTAANAIARIIEAAWDSPQRSAICELAGIVLENADRITPGQAADLDRAAKWLAEAGCPAPLERFEAAA